MAYEEFSTVYDLLMYDYSYEEVFDFLKNVWEKNEHRPESILEMACGTGSLTEKIWKIAPVIAFDSSTDMLAQARNKLGNRKRVQLLHEDMRTFHISKTFDTIVCMCDSLNYLTKLSDVEKTFQQVNQHLKEGGIFIFDVNMKEKYQKMGETVYTDEVEDVFYVWENHFVEEEMINNYEINFFVQEGNKYKRFFEKHMQRAYEIQELNTVLSESIPLEKVNWYNGYSLNEDLDGCERLVGVIQKRR